MLIGNPMIFRQLPLEDALAKMVKDYDALELWPQQINECKTPGLRNKLAEYISSLGLKAIRLNAADPDYFQVAGSIDDMSGIVKGMKSDIDIVADLGMTQLLTWEGRKPKNAKHEDIYGWILDRTVSIFEQVLDYATHKGISLCVEVHPFTLGIDTDWLIQLYDRLNSPGFGIVYDCCHFAVGLPDSYIESIYKLQHRIKHVHFSDSDKKTSELHFPPGAGCLDLDGIVNALKEIGFDGSMMLDLWLYPFPQEGSLVGVPYVKQVMKRLGLV